MVGGCLIMDEKRDEARRKRTRNLVQIGAVTVSVLGDIPETRLPEYKAWLQWAFERWINEQIGSL